MLGVPYRWRPRTVWPNLLSIWHDLYYGVYNLWRWAPVVWGDRDFDWEFLAKIMETKLRWMADNTQYWHVARAQRDRKQMLVCAALVKRLRDDHYFRNSAIRFGRTSDGAVRATNRRKEDLRYLGVFIGKYLNKWWD